MSRHTKTLLLGSGIMIAGAILCLSWPGQYLEENLGLSFLFKLRGTRPTPSQVAIIAIDLESARKLELSSRVEQWPRLLHARLIEQLAQAGAKVIALDIIFKEKRDKKHDRILAESIKKAGNVVLIALMEKEKRPIYSDSRQLTGQIEIQKLVQPIDQLKAVAAATAPFPIPKVPVRVNRYWTLASDMDNSPTLPLVAFQIFARADYNHLVEWLQAAHIPVDDLPPNDRLLLDSRKVDQIVYKIREKFLTEPDLLKLLWHNKPPPDGDSENKPPPLLDRLIRMYAAPNSHFLNYYGPPGTIETVPYHRLASRGEENDWVISDLSQFRDKAVFIGLSERHIPFKSDGFYTVYSQSDGVDLNGVEIAATAFANILENRPVRILPPYLRIGIVFICGALLVLICRYASNLMSAAGVIVFACIYLWISKISFSANGTWLPVVTVLLFQAPLAFMMSVLTRYTDVNQERKAIRRAFQFYLPPEIIDQTANQGGSVIPDGQLVHATILCSDLGEYTAFSERTSPEALSQLMHEYFTTLFKPVQASGGLISDLAGDSMMALWATKEPDVSSRYRACESAIRINAALPEFWVKSDLQVHLPTRIGIHYGQVRLGNVGAGSHYQYKATGDAVNTAARIENLNKHLQTSILVSTDALHGVNDFLTRKVGRFLLSGKSTPIGITELMTRMETATDDQKYLVRMFTNGLSAYLDRSWDTALGIFNQILKRFPSDGPTLFFANQCRHLRSSPPDSTWDGVVIVPKK